MEMKINELSHSSFNEMCRLCLGSADTNIFKMEFQDNQLVDIFEILTSLKIEKDDHLPHKICKECLEEILRCYKFRQKCLEAHEILLQLAENDEDKPKVEEPPEILQVKLEMDNAYEDSLDSESDNTNEDSNIDKKSRRTKKSAPKITHCYVCNVSFDSHKELVLHRNQPTHPKGVSCVVPCPICAKPFMVKRMKQHVLSHSQEKLYVCSVCNKGFNAAGNYKRHRLIHTENGEKPFKCDICGKGYSQAQSKKEHMATHTTQASHICKECGKEFTAWDDFRTHVVRECPKKLSPDPGPLVESKKYTCRVCGKLLTSRCGLKLHTDLHVGHKRFLCQHCGKSFVLHTSYKTHVRTHEGIKPYVCTLCGKAFTQLASLNVHKLIHTGEKPHVCALCKKTFTQKSHLTYHMQQIHSTEKPFVCVHCGKGFALKGNLTAHLRTHTGETPYICNYCGRGFHNSNNMNKHKRTQHENKKSARQTLHN